MMRGPELKEKEAEKKGEKELFRIDRLVFPT